MVQGLYIPVDTDRPIEIRTFDRLEDYQSAVGGWIEAVDVMPLGSTLYVNEEGLLRQLPFNSRATFLCWYELPPLRHRTVLVGDAVLVGIPDDDGNDTNLPEETLALLVEKTEFVVITLYEGSPRWVPHPFAYENYFDAVIWAMELSDQATGARGVRVLSLTQFEKLQREEVERENWGAWEFDDDE